MNYVRIRRESQGCQKSQTDSRLANRLLLAALTKCTAYK
jgi:hypothetical protein